MRVEFPAVGGKPYSGSLALKNAGGVKTRVRAELLDLYVDENTTPQFVPKAPGEADFSCRSWLSVTQWSLRWMGRSQVMVRYSVRVHWAHRNAVIIAPSFPYSAPSHRGVRYGNAYRGAYGCGGLSNRRKTTDQRE